MSVLFHSPRLLHYKPFAHYFQILQGNYYVYNTQQDVQTTYR